MGPRQLQAHNGAIKWAQRPQTHTPKEPEPEAATQGTRARNSHTRTETATQEPELETDKKPLRNRGCTIREHMRHISRFSLVSDAVPPPTPPPPHPTPTPQAQKGLALRAHSSAARQKCWVLFGGPLEHETHYRSGMPQGKK